MIDAKENCASLSQLLKKPGCSINYLSPISQNEVMCLLYKKFQKT